MIQANELRIGNWVRVGDIESTVCLIDHNKFIQLQGNAVVNRPEQIDPITLTPEILGRCGFEKKLMENGKYCYLLKKEEITLRIFISGEHNGNVFTFLSIKGGKEKAIFITNLHQLQNIHPLLWFEELEIKELEHAEK